MNIVRYALGRRTGYGLVEDSTVYAAEGSIFGRIQRGERVAAFQDVKLLPPVRPTKILAIGKNYLDHAREMPGDLPPAPLIFIKANSALNGPGGPIVVPPWAGRVEHEGELVVVIGKKLQRVSEAEALDGILGYTCGNDVTAREIQYKDGQWARGKSFDTFACIGPWITLGGSPDGRRVECRVNGQVKQSASTDLLIFKVPYVLSYVSRSMTLYPGDIVYTGTPAGVGPLKPGDTVEVEVQGVGILSNPVVAG